jgi:alpha-amylase
MSKVKFVFCTHNHQPVGNFGWVFEKAYQLSYKPFLDVLSKHADIKWNLHLSGILWEYLEQEHKEYIKDIQELVKKGRVEVLSGGYFEPIMSSIPDKDKLGQIEKLTKYVKNKFGSNQANGMWLAERVWEPSMPKVFAQAGINYTVLDDCHFANVGFNIDKLNGYYTTEEEGYKLNIFPISQKMRYLIPFSNVEDTIEYFKFLIQESSMEDPIVVMADDGEKFGMWPSTYKHVYENKWLNKFLTALENNADIVETVTFSEILRLKKSSGRVYLPCSSYFEMSQWVLPSQQQESFEDILNKSICDAEGKKFLKGGFWRNFLVKYEESNNMHKKMLYVSSKLKCLKNNDKKAFRKAKDFLYAAQCNCAYWHGVFGGIYLPHLRNAIYSNSIKAENYYNKTMFKKFSWNIFDLDCDDQEEYLYESKTQNIYVTAFCGGSIFEWDIFKINYNLLDTLTRRYEPYHKKLRENIDKAVLTDDSSLEVQSIHNNIIKVKEFGLDKYLVYDNYRRSSLIDHFFSCDIEYDACLFGNYQEKGDFVSGRYEAKLISVRKFLKKQVKLSLYRYGNVDGKNVKLIKEIFPLENGYHVDYSIRNNCSDILEIYFSPEQMFAFSSKTGDDIGNLKNIEIWKRYDSYLKIEVELKLSEKCDLFVYPVETVINSDNGYEKIYQGTAVFPLVKCIVEPGKEKKYSMRTVVNFK